MKLKKINYLLVVFCCFFFFVKCDNGKQENDEKNRLGAVVDTIFYPTIEDSIRYTGITYYSLVDSAYFDTLTIYRPTHDSLYIVMKLLYFNKLTGEYARELCYDKFKIDTRGSYYDEYKKKGFRAISNVNLISKDSMHYVFKWMDYDNGENSRFHIFKGKLFVEK